VVDMADILGKVIVGKWSETGVNCRLA